MISAKKAEELILEMGKTPKNSRLLRFSAHNWDEDPRLQEAAKIRVPNIPEGDEVFVSRAAVFWPRSLVRIRPLPPFGSALILNKNEPESAVSELQAKINEFFADICSSPAVLHAAKARRQISGIFHSINLDNTRRKLYLDAHFGELIRTPGIQVYGGTVPKSSAKNTSPENVCLIWDNECGAPHVILAPRHSPASEEDQKNCVKRNGKAVG